MCKVAILTCDLANRTCTGAGCMKAFNNREAFFEGYKDDTKLVAFMHCNGCTDIMPYMPREDEGMIKKVDRLKNECVDVVHIGVCRNKRDGYECSRMTEIACMIEERGIKVVRGTHSEG